jgi:hypothetical protein
MFIFAALACLALNATPPNLVVVFCDDLGYADIGPFGGKLARTPHLDRMAREGRTFTNFHVSQPVCSASRASLLTGCYANRVGIHGALGPNAKIGLNPGTITLTSAPNTAFNSAGIVFDTSPNPPAFAGSRSIVIHNPRHPCVASRPVTNGFDDPMRASEA